VLHPRSTRGWRQDAGAAAVEFTLVALILFALIFGIIAFGIALFNQQGAVQAAREAARQASVGIANAADCQAALTTGRNAVGSAKSSFKSMDIRIADNSYQQPLLVDVHYNLDFSAIGWLPGIPNQLPLTQTAHAAIEVGHKDVVGDEEHPVCKWTP
jgi:type II secretory pathway pseudopilin PulG